MLVVMKDSDGFTSRMRSRIVAFNVNHSSETHRIWRLDYERHTDNKDFVLVQYFNERLKKFGRLIIVEKLVE